MPTRFTVPAALLAVVAVIALPAPAIAAPRRDRGLTIAVAPPGPLSAGEGALIYGQLQGSDVANQQIRLYHRLAGQSAFTFVQATRTNQAGFYEFPRAENVVMTNRAWFVRGPAGAHSRTIHERVSALVSLASDSNEVLTGQPVSFSGHVTPAHRFQAVLLQQQTKTNGSGWRTLRIGRTGAGSSFDIRYAWRRPGVYTLRAYFPGDRRNIAGESDQLTIVVSQRQTPSFTIAPSRPVITYGSSVTITGVLDQPGTDQPEPNTSVTLLGHAYGSSPQAIATATTSSTGGYTFTVSPVHNEVYRVITTLAPHRHTAALYEGVADAVTLNASPTSVQIGQPVTFSGSVLPGKAGHPIYLQREDANGSWDNVAVQRLGPSSSYTFKRAFAQPGTRAFRVRIYGGPANVGGASAPVQINVSDTATPPQSLAQAS